MEDKLVKFEKSLLPLMRKIDESDFPRQGDIVFNFIGEKPIRVALKPKSETSIHRTLTKEAPRLEISGNHERIHEILEGKKDPIMAFLEGSITVRGDVNYLKSILRILELKK